MGWREISKLFCLKIIKLLWFFSSNSQLLESFAFQLFDDGGPIHTETSSLICCANQWTGFYKIETSVMNQLKLLQAAINKPMFYLTPNS